MRWAAPLEQQRQQRDGLGHHHQHGQNEAIIGDWVDRGIYSEEVPRPAEALGHLHHQVRDFLRGWLNGVQVPPHAVEFARGQVRSPARREARVEGCGCFTPSHRLLFTTKDVEGGRHRVDAISDSQRKDDLVASLA